VPEDLLDRFRTVHAKATEAFNRGDLHTALAGLPPDLEWHPLSTDPEPAVHRGPGQIREWFEEYRSVFDEWESKPLEYAQLGAATILVHHVIRGTSRGARVPVEVNVFEVWEFDGGRPVCVRQFDSRAVALEAINV
jgi:ketosteroid isomerase-like protein